MTHLDSAEKMPHPCHDVVRSPVGFLLDCQDAVDDGTTLWKIHQSCPQCCELTFSLDDSPFALTWRSSNNFNMRSPLGPLTSLAKTISGRYRSESRRPSSPRTNPLA